VSVAQRVIVFGVDGLMLSFVDHLVRQGRAPNIGRMFSEGASTPLLPFVSSWGPINWMSFATGASPGSTWAGRVRVRGIEAEEPCAHNGYQSEPLWAALDRQGRGSTIISYPACWPPTGQRAIIAMPDAAGTDLSPVAMARPRVLMTEGLTQRYAQPPGTRAGWLPLAGRGRGRREAPTLPTPTMPNGWRNLPSGASFATQFDLIGIDGSVLMIFEALVATGGESPRVYVCREKDAANPLAALWVGEWSRWLEVDSPDGRRGTVRLKLLELGDDGREVAVAHSMVCPTARYGYPRSIEPGLIASAGPYASGSGADLRPTDPFWSTAVEEAEYEAKWLARAAAHLMAVNDSALFMTVFRPPDAANHGALAFVEPRSPFHGRPETDVAYEVMAGAYGAVDKAIGALMQGADERTVIALASDHGAAVNQVTCDVYRLLEEEGLLSLTERDGRWTVDWSKTQAYVRPTRSGSEIYVNLVGREPHGIVPPEDCAAVQERIVALLHDWREPVSGRRAVAVALGKRESALLGYWGEPAGDVQFIYNAGFVWGEQPPGKTIGRTAVPSVNHGPQIATAAGELSTNMGMLALWGPGIRRGYRRDEEVSGPPRMCDAAPTIAHLLDCAPPQSNEGAVLRDMLSSD